MADERIKILIIEDEETHAELIKRSFGHASTHYELLVGQNLAAARRLLQDFKPDLVISDLLLPDGKGTELIDAATRPSCPFIIMTSFGDEHAAVEAIKAGALDYVVKSVNSMTEMPRIVDHALREWAHIIEKSQAEEALASSEERYRAIFENCGNAMIIIEDDTVISMCNREFESLSGYATAEVQGRLRWTELIAEPADKQRMLEYHRLRRCEPGLAPHSYEFKLVDRDNKLKDVMVTVSLIPGTRTSLAAMSDISEHKRAEAAMHSLENQLTQARKLEAIGRLAGGISHDFNNLLTVICGYAEMLLENSCPPAESIREGLEEILGAGKRARDLTRQLLAFGRKQVLKLQPVNLNEVITGFEKMLRRLIGEDIEVSTDLADGLPAIMADVTQIEQIILNLALNARDALPCGGRIAISTALLPGRELSQIQDLAADEYVRLSVSDNGCGMDAATLDQIYEPFFTTKAKDKGTGLGLATVYGIVKQHGGTVVCESAVGQGSTFSVYLPRTALNSDSETPCKPSGDLPCGQGTILLVEDDISMRHMVCRMLSNSGYKVLAAADSQDALRLAREIKPIDLLLSDIVMPGLNGPQVKAEVTALQPSIKTLFMSGYSAEAIQDRGLASGQLRLLSKPFSAPELLRAIKEILLQSG